MFRFLPIVRQRGIKNDLKYIKPLKASSLNKDFFATNRQTEPQIRNQINLHLGSLYINERVTFIQKREALRILC